MRGLRKFAVFATAVTAVGGAVSLPAVAGAAGGAGPSVTVVATGLNNPRGVAYSHGALYVAEAGKGGSDCPTGAKGPEGGQLCLGRTGALAEISHGRAHDVLSGLISESDIPGGLAALGITNVAATPSGLRALFGESVIGLLTSLPQGDTLSPSDGAAARHEIGRLTNVARGGIPVVADVGDADYTWAAVHQNLVPSQFPDSNPNALAVAGDTTYIADAGSNILSAVRDGQVTQLAFVPNPPVSDAVPTCVAVGPDHNVYLGQLAPGAAPNKGNIYRYNVGTHRLSVWKTGFNVVDGCGFDKAGNFYAVEFQSHGFNPGPTGNPAGDVIKVAPDGARSVLGAGHLFFPQGFALDGKGGFYVSNWSIMTGTPAGPGAPTGQVVRIGP